MTAATITPPQGTSLTAAADAAARAGTTPATAADTARTTLTGNFNSFLTLLMTQLKNQDPTSPLDTNQFTSQLVQFSSVEQQINANTNLQQLIQLTQGAQVLQASSVVGKHLVVTADHVPLQDGNGQVNFTTKSTQPVVISITTDAGAKIRNAVVTASAGENQFVWDGRNDGGSRVPDGSYRIAVIGANPDGTMAALPFTVQGLATGMTQQNNNVSLKMGTQAVAFTAVQQVLP